jgi:hypothetical protein
VPGLGVGEEVDGVVGEGEGVAVAPDDRYVGEGPAELGRHAVAGFDRDHFGAAGVQEGGRDAGAGADVCDAGAGEGVTCEVLDGVEEGGWVGGAVLGVLGCGGVEGVGSGGG